MKVKIIIILVLLFSYSASNAGLFPTGELYENSITKEQKYINYNSFLWKTTSFPFFILADGYDKKDYIYHTTNKNKLKLDDFTMNKKLIILINLLVRVLLIILPFIMFIIVSKKINNKLTKSIILPIIAVLTIPWILFSYFL